MRRSRVENFEGFPAHRSARCKVTFRISKTQSSQTIPAQKLWYWNLDGNGLEKYLASDQKQRFRFLGGISSILLSYLEPSEIGGENSQVYLVRIVEFCAIAPGKV
jgi:hypothetical protein